MYNLLLIDELMKTIHSMDGVQNKTEVISGVVNKFNLVKDRSVFYCKDFAIRFSQAQRENFSNTVLSLSALQKYDDKPFFVCLVMPKANRIFLANTSFLSKISHSSQQLREDNIKGSFNGGDIMRDIGKYKNEEQDFENLFLLHEGVTFEENLTRLVESTNQIVGRDLRYKNTPNGDNTILDSPQRAINFINSDNYYDLSADLSSRVKSVENEIVIASLIDNVNLRGRIIEYLVTHGEGDGIRKQIMQALKSNTQIPNLRTDDDLGDYNKEYDLFNTKTDIKTKVLYFNSAPKAYNIDKLLDFLSKDKSIYMIYFIGIDSSDEIVTFLCSMFDHTLLNGTAIQFHWAGRNSRGVSQLTGNVINEVLANKKNDINKEESINWVKKLLNL